MRQLNNTSERLTHLTLSPDRIYLPPPSIPDPSIDDDGYDDEFDHPPRSLYDAVMKDNPDAVERFLADDTSNDLKIDSLDGSADGPEAFHIACLFGKLEIVKIFLAAGAKLDSTNAFGLQPIHQACRCEEKLDVVQYLLSLYDEPSKQQMLNTPSNLIGFTPLHFAVSGLESLEMVKFLLNNGACPIPDNRGRLPSELCYDMEAKSLLQMHEKKSSSKSHLNMKNLNKFFEKTFG